MRVFRSAAYCLALSGMLFAMPGISLAKQDQHPTEKQGHHQVAKQDEHHFHRVPERKDDADCKKDKNGFFGRLFCHKHTPPPKEDNDHGEHPSCHKHNPPPPPPVTAEVHGILYEDKNGDSIRNGSPIDPGLAGWTVRVNGPVVKETTTTATGGYALIGLPPGNYIVELALPTGWIETTSPPTVSLVSGQILSNVFLGAFKKVTVSGLIWRDSNSNSIFDPAEKPLSAWTAFADAPTFDGVPSAGEISATTGLDGKYLLSDIGPGTYRICEVLKTQWSQVFPMSLPAGDSCYTLHAASGVNVTGNDFGNFFIAPV